MICPNCGREVPDGTVCPCTLAAPALSDNPALNVLKAIGSSPLFLALAALFSASALLTIFSSLGVSDALSSVYVYAYQMGLDMYQVESLMDAMRSTSVFSAVLGSIPAILVAVAMWLHFATCRNRQSGNISTAGLTICKVLCYISMISLCVIALLLVGGFVLIIVAFLVSDVPWGEMFGYYGSYYGSYGSSYTDEEATIAIVVVLAVIALMITFAMVLAITYQASFIRMINRTKTVAQTGMADNRVSGYLTGMTGLVAASSILSGLAAVFTSPLAGAASLTQGASYILMIILLRKYGKEMNAVLYPPIMPVAPPMYGGFPVQQNVPVQNAPVQNAPMQPQQQVVQPQQPADGFQQPPQDGQGPIF